MIDKLLLLQKELINLKDGDKVVITAPRRAGKTTLLRNIVACYIGNGNFNQHSMLFIAPDKEFELLNLYPITTQSQLHNIVKGTRPLITVVDEAAYCDNWLLEEIDKNQDSPKVFVTTPKPVGYIWNEKIWDWECTNYVKRLIDQDKARVFSYHFKDFDKELQEKINKNKVCCTRRQWRCEYNGEWVE